MNVSEMYAETGRLLNDPDNQRWTQSVLLTRFNLAQPIIMGQTNALKTSESPVLTAGSGLVPLNANTMDIVRVYRSDADGNVFPLDGKSREELDYLYPNWRQIEAGVPKVWFYDASNQQMVLVPPPDSANSFTGAIGVTAVRKPADLVNSTDIPFDSNNQLVPYHMVIPYWTAAECLMDEKTPESLAKSKFYRSDSLNNPGKYEAEIKRILAKFDAPEAIPARIMWRPTGGRLSMIGTDRKSSPI